MKISIKFVSLLNSFHCCLNPSARGFTLQTASLASSQAVSYCGLSYKATIANSYLFHYLLHS